MKVIDTSLPIPSIQTLQACVVSEHIRIPLLNCVCNLELSIAGIWKPDIPRIDAGTSFPPSRSMRVNSKERKYSHGFYFNSM